MTFNLTTGKIHRTEKTVTAEDTASRYGSGMVAVFATPALVALMENAAMENVRPDLPPGYLTVGTEISIRHLKATPVGMKVSCEAVLTAVQGKKLSFSVNAWDETGLIGTGSHCRYIVNEEDFMKRISN